MSEVAKLRKDHPHWAHRHRLGLCGERARPARAAGIAGGCHGPREPWLAVSQKKTTG